MTRQRRASIAIVGAGLAGLAAAYRLQSAGFDVSVLEASSRPGGRVQTLRRDGYVIDTGASALADSYHAYLALAAELGLADQVVPTPPVVGIARGSRVHLLQMDRMLWSGATTPLLSWWSKFKTLRLAWDVARAKSRGQLDYADLRKAAPLDSESASDYARRRLNAEIDDYLGAPIVRTMLIADPGKISKVELFSGIANIFGSRILTLKGGQGSLPERLSERVAPQFGSTVTRVSERADGVDVQWRGGDGQTYARAFDAAVIACPLPAATALCVDHQALLRPLHDALDYTMAFTVAIATRTRPQSPAFLIQMPAVEDADIALVFLDHNKCADRAPPGRGLIDFHWETDAARRMAQASDDAIVERTLQTLHRLFPELRGQVEFAHVTRWNAALPLTRVGAYRAIGEFNQAMDPRSRLQFAADYMSAAGQNTAVEMGNRATQRLQQLLPA